MTSKQWTMIVLVVVLGGFSLYLNRDWFGAENIQIHHRSRPARAGFFRRNRPPPAAATDPIFFAFDRKLKLNSLKVIPVSEIETNKYPHPICELVSDSNSVPVAEWSYGMPIRGMRPSVKGAGARRQIPAPDPGREDQSPGGLRPRAPDTVNHSSPVSNAAGAMIRHARTRGSR